MISIHSYTPPLFGCYRKSLSPGSTHKIHSFNRRNCIVCNYPYTYQYSNVDNLERKKNSHFLPFFILVVNIWMMVCKKIPIHAAKAKYGSLVFLVNVIFLLLIISFILSYDSINIFYMFF